MLGPTPVNEHVDNVDNGWQELAETKRKLNNYNPLMKFTEYTCMHYINEQILLHSECSIIFYELASCSLREVFHIYSLRKEEAPKKWAPHVPQTNLTRTDARKE